MVPSNPAFVAIVRTGSSRQARTISTAVFWSAVRLMSASRDFDARRRAVPPPGMIPSSTAARVADTASSTRPLRSFISSSVGAPTRITATPPVRRASRSCSFSRS